MERHIHIPVLEGLMLLDVNTTQTDLQIQCTLHQNGISRDFPPKKKKKQPKQY